MYSLLILGAGSGSRMQLGYNKLLYVHKNKPVINYTIESFLKFKEFSEIIITSSKTDYEKFKKIIPNDPRIKIITGGDSRAQSVKNSLSMLSNKYVFIHDGARCFINESDIKKMITNISDHSCYSAYKKVVDTVHYGENGVLSKKLDREKLYAMQTPQVFKTDLLRKNYDKIQDFTEVTDEVGIFLDNNLDVKLVLFDYQNEKFTNIQDIRSLNDL